MCHKLNCLSFLVLLSFRFIYNFIWLLFLLLRCTSHLFIYFLSFLYAALSIFLNRMNVRVWMQKKYKIISVFKGAYRHFLCVLELKDHVCLMRWNYHNQGEKCGKFWNKCLELALVKLLFDGFCGRFLVFFWVEIIYFGFLDADLVIRQHQFSLGI